VGACYNNPTRIFLKICELRDESVMIFTGRTVQYCRVYLVSCNAQLFPDFGHNQKLRRFIFYPSMYGSFF
jgi:hypothetical protein